MDLDFRNRSDLSEVLVNKYIESSGDKELPKLLLFYKCYRAYVRGKVVGFKLHDPNVETEDRKKARSEAHAYFRLAAFYAQNFEG
jgi:aminoglycoside phosphotransferase family enzyme